MATVIDASGLVLGRMATSVAKKALQGERVHIINAEQAIVAGSSKKAIQSKYRFKREVGTMRKGPFFPREPHRIVKHTIRGMIPYQSSHGREAYKRIQAHIGVPKELAGVDSITLEAARRDIRTFMTVAEISRFLGRPEQPTTWPTRADVQDVGEEE